MIPTLSLGKGCEAPSIEIMPRDIYPMIAVMLQGRRTMSPDDIYNISFFSQMDTLFLKKETERFFLDLHEICQRVVSGDLTRVSLEGVDPDIAEPLAPYAGDGIHAGVRAAARRYLDFLGANPDYWPPR